MELKKVYAKFRANHPLSDDELSFLIAKLTYLEGTLEDLGIEYRITTNAIRQDVNALKSFQFHRKFR